MKKIILLTMILSSFTYAYAPKRKCIVLREKLDKMFEAKMKGDFATFLAGLDENIVWEIKAKNQPWGGKFVGKEGEQSLTTFFGKVAEMNMGVKSFEYSNSFCDPKRRTIILQGSERFFNLSDESRIADVDLLEIWTFGWNGKVRRLNAYLDTDTLTKEILD